MFKKLLAVLLALVMVVGVCACGGNGQQGDDPTEYEDIWNLEGTIFPLKEKTSFTILTSGYRYEDIEKITQCEDWKNLMAATNLDIKFEFVGEYDAPETATNLQTRLMGGEYGDAIVSVYLDNLTKKDIDDLAEAGMIVPITDYMNNPEIMPFFYNTITTKDPYLITAMKSNDGEVYAPYGVGGTAIYTAGEGLLQINEAWFNAWKEAKGKTEAPKTIEEFEDMLLFFRDNDLNGNGKKDETPYFIAQETYNGTSSLEASMGMFGIGIKDNASDMNIMIDDNGKCYFVHTTEEYKQGLETFAKWFSEDLIWKEIFTGNAETIANTVADAKNNFGLINCCYDIDGFVEIVPPTVEGIDAKYHMHPAARVGIASQPYGVITDKCKNPEILAAFFDLMYDLDNCLTWRYGSKAWKDGEITIDENGLYILNVPSTPSTDPNTDPTTRAIHDYIWTIESYSPSNLEKIDVEAFLGDRACVRGSKLYSELGIWNKTSNLWPRCSILSEYSDDFAVKYTDTSSLLKEYRAKFITGKLDVAKDWDEFQSKLKKLGIDELREMVQKSYDAYLNK